MKDVVILYCVCLHNGVWLGTERREGSVITIIPLYIYFIDQWSITGPGCTHSYYLVTTPCILGLVWYIDS